MATMSEPGAGSARAVLTAAAGFGAIGLSVSGIYAFTGFGIPCPWRYLTHTLCPFCGSTTLGAHLLHGDVASAWSANQFVFLLLVAAMVAGFLRVVEVLGGPRLRLPRRLADQRLWYAALGTAAVGFAVLRNLIPLA